MPSSYEPLPIITDEENDTERKLLVKSDEDLIPYNARAPSTKILMIAYLLFTLTIFFAGTNLVTGFKALRVAQHDNAAVDTLPRPNIFVGLPKMAHGGNRKEGEYAKGHHDEHSIHSHSSCKLDLCSFPVRQRI